MFFPLEQKKILDVMTEEEVGIEVVMTGVGIKDSEVKTAEEAEIMNEEIKDSEVKTAEEAEIMIEEINKLEMVIGTAKVVVTIIFHSERSVTDVANQKVEAELINEVNEGHKEGRTAEVIHVEDLEIMETVQEIIVVGKEEAEVQTILEIEIDAENT